MEKAVMKTCFVLTSVFLGGGLLILGIPSPAGSEKVALNRISSKKTTPIGTAYILIDKSDYELHVYDDKGWYATYPVVFGNSSLSDKKMEGDKNTPEGTFKIVSKRIHEKWHRSEEHTSELQSLAYLVCRLLLEKKKKKK